MNCIKCTVYIPSIFVEEEKIFIRLHTLAKINSIITVEPKSRTVTDTLG